METAEKLRVIRGFLLFSRLGSVAVVGCRDCVSREARAEAFRTLLLGWWSFPWGLLTPFAVVLNLFRSRRRVNRSMLGEVMALAGMRIEDFEVGDDGMTGSQRDLVAAVARILGQVAIQSGPGSREWMLARRALIDFADGHLDEPTADSWLRTLATEQLAPGATPRELLIRDHRDRLTLLRVAVEVAVADGKLSGSERFALEGLADRLQIPRTELDAILHLMVDVGQDGVSVSAEVAHAYALLGLRPGASTAQIRSAYKAMQLANHPDLAEDRERAEATRRSAEINAAYDLLIGVAAA